MSLKTKPLDELNEEALRLLMQELGAANTARFIRQFTTGSGNYTEERRERLKDQTMDEVLEQIQNRRQRTGA